LLSPYQTSTVKRFGEYAVNLSRPPEPWIKEVAVQFKPGNSQPASLPLVMKHDHDSLLDAAANRTSGKRSGNLSDAMS
jgi:hypothetical protein